MSTKYNVVTSLSVVLTLLAALEVKAKSITIWNATRDAICIAFIRTEIKSKTSLITGKDRLTTYYHDNSAVSAQYRQVAPGQEIHLTAYNRNIGTYDRTLWIMPISSGACESLQNIDPVNNKLPAGAQALEIGSKERIVIVPAGPGKYALKSWTQKLGDEIERLSQAFKATLAKGGRSWEDFKEAAGEQWSSMKAAFNRTYEDLKKKGAQAKTTLKQKSAQANVALKKKAAQAKRKLFGPSDDEIRAQVEGEGEEGGGEEPGRPLVGAGSEGHEAWKNEGFGIDQPEPSAPKEGIRTKWRV